jgi:hypothetical protein
MQSLQQPTASASWAVICDAVRYGGRLVQPAWHAPTYLPACLLCAAFPPRSCPQPKPEVGIQFGAGGTSSAASLAVEGSRDVRQLVQTCQAFLQQVGCPPRFLCWSVGPA